MEKRTDNEHVKIRKELEKTFNDISKHMDYVSQIGCKEGDGKPDKENDGDDKTEKRKKTEVKLCKHRAYCCTLGNVEKKKAHKPEVSKYCMFNGQSKEEIASVRETYLILIAISETGGIGKLMMNWS